MHTGAHTRTRLDVPNYNQNNEEIYRDMSKLLIVESPTKARTIGRMLDSSYKIMASVGHIRDLPDRSLGIDIENGFKPAYVDTPRSAKVIAELRKAAAAADEIYLAPDPDREGEAIAWHLSEVLKGRKKKTFHRVTFHEITRSAISRALQDKHEIDMNLVDAQQARRVLDRLVGYKVSPLLWSRVEKGISAGRVQSVALRLVVERERAIRAFVPEEYWVFSLICLLSDGRELKTRLFKIDGKDFSIGSAEAAEAAYRALAGGGAPVVAKVDGAERQRKAPPPFTTSTLQQSASNAFRFSASNTMRYAQQLYEGVDLGGAGPVGLITYMRTDSVTISREAQDAALDFIRREYGDRYAPGRPNFFKNKAAAQEAHEAIRPTDVTRTPESLAAFLDPAQLKLYTMIYRRFLASQMAPCIQSLTTVDIGVDGADRHAYTFRATATVIVFDGYTKVFDDDAKAARRGEAEAAAEVLGSLRERDQLTAKAYEKEQKFTEPPPRYTEATLIKELEENGIGRPSTYATILHTIQQRSYVSREQGKLIPSELGEKTCDFLVQNLPALFEVGFTADMEKKLDEIEGGDVVWTDMLADFYGRFEGWLTDARQKDAPPEETAALLIRRLENAPFEPPRKTEKRTYDEKRLYTSMRQQFETDGRISARQYQTLLNMLAKYDPAALDDPGLPADMRSRLAEAADRNRTLDRKREENQVDSALKDGYERLFKAFDAVQWESSSRFDEKKFFESLKKQALDGRKLSPKQLAVLVRIAGKYQADVTDLDFVRNFLDMKESGEEQGDGAAPAADNSAIVDMLKHLDQVKNWVPPAKKGRSTFDDQAFYQSLSRQFREKKQLSPKQQAALARLVKKYPSGGSAS